MIVTEFGTVELGEGTFLGNTCESRPLRAPGTVVGPRDTAILRSKALTVALFRKRPTSSPDLRRLV